MRFAFDEEQLMFRDTVREVLARECPPGVVRAAWTNEHGRAPAVWKQLGELGVLGMAAGEAWGGLGLDALDWVLVAEETGRYAVPEPVIDTLAVAVPALAASDSAALQDRWLGRLAAGRATAAAADGDGARVCWADTADVLLLRAGDELHAVERGAVALSACDSVDRARRLFDVRWTPSPATRVTADASAAFDRGALATAAQLVGLAVGMLDRTVEYVTVRQQFGVPIGSFQAIKHRLADALSAIEFARPVVYRAAYAVAADAPDRAVRVSMAKAFASDAARTVARHALQCHGAIGYSFEYDLHLWMKRAWCLASAWGDAAWHRERVGFQLIGDDQ